MQTAAKPLCWEAAPARCWEPVCRDQDYRRAEGVLGMLLFGSPCFLIPWPQKLVPVHVSHWGEEWDEYSLVPSIFSACRFDYLSTCVVSQNYQYFSLNQAVVFDSVSSVTAGKEVISCCISIKYFDGLSFHWRFTILTKLFWVWVVKKKQGSLTFSTKMNFYQEKAWGWFICLLKAGLHEIPCISQQYNVSTLEQFASLFIFVWSCYLS